MAVLWSFLVVDQSKICWIRIHSACFLFSCSLVLFVVLGKNQFISPLYKIYTLPKEEKSKILLFDCKLHSYLLFHTISLESNQLIVYRICSSGQGRLQVAVFIRAARTQILQSLWSLPFTSFKQSGLSQVIKEGNEWTLRHSKYLFLCESTPQRLRRGWYKRTEALRLQRQ